MDMPHQPAPVADHNVRADYAIGTNRHVLADRGAPLDTDGRIDYGHRRFHANGANRTRTHSTPVCPGHARLYCIAKDVDARHKAGP